MSKKRKSGNKKAGTESKLNLVTAILNLVIAIILLYERFSGEGGEGRNPLPLKDNKTPAQCQITMLVYILSAVSIILSLISITISIKNRR